MAAHLFLDMPNNVNLGTVEMQTEFATSDVTRLLSVPSDQGNNHVVTTYPAVNDVFSDNKVTKANSFGVKNSVTIDLVALIV
jgi:hypothetical protein